MEAKTAVELGKTVFDALDRQDLLQISDLLAEDVIVASMAGITLTGHDAVMEYIRQEFAGYPDFSLQIVDILTGETRVGVEYVATWTETSEVPATGARVTVPGFWVITVKDGKITHIAQYFDMFSMLVQVGMIPESLLVQLGRMMPESALAPA